MITLARKASFQLGLVCIIIAAALLPFSGKAFHLDDPLFIWTGMHLLRSPADFFGFAVNWYGSLQPMAVVMKNPPLFAYYLALAGGLAGWSEVVMHLACLVPTLAVGVGTWLLAREFAAEPLLATLAGLLTPAFLLSASTVMCDVMLLAFWVWALYFWLRGCEASDPRLLTLAALLTAAAVLTKYFGISLIPLLVLYSLTDRKGRSALPYLLIPVGIVIFYQLWTRQLYGVGLFSDAFSYSAKARHLTADGVVAALVTGLSYTGGGVLTAVCFAPLLSGRRFLPVIGGLLAAAFLLLVIPADINGYRPGLVQGRWFQSGQLLFFVAAGMGILIAALADLYHLRDGKAAVLAAWIIGTFLFACFVNWTISGRNIIPMAPAVGILLARRMALIAPSWPRGRLAAMGLLLMFSLLVSLLVVSADASLANSSRQAATEITGRYGNGGAQVYFQGHWGFQYYMQQYGALPIDFKNAALATKDIMVVPGYGTNISAAGTAGFLLVETVSPLPGGRVSTMDATLGAGFYMSQKAALPFAFGLVKPVHYNVFLFTPEATAATAR